MRKLFCSFLFAVTLAMAAVPAWAADADLSDDQVAQIRQNCKQAQSVLQRLQATDVATRINRGRIYENLISKLITPLNSRVSANNYDASGLTSAGADINRQFTAFKSDYSSYENSFAKVLSIDCEADPRGFYDQLTATRDARGRVADDISNLNTGLSHYTDAFSVLSASIDG